MSQNVLHPAGLPQKNYHKLSEKQLEQFYKNNTSTTKINNNNTNSNIPVNKNGRSTTSKKGSKNVRSISLSKTAASGLAYVQKINNPASIDISCHKCGRAIRWQANFCPNCGESVAFPTRTFLPRPIDPNDPFLKEKKKKDKLPKNLKSSIHSAYGGDRLFPSSSKKRNSNNNNNNKSRRRRSNNSSNNVKNQKQQQSSQQQQYNMIPTFNKTVDASNSSIIINDGNAIDGNIEQQMSNMETSVNNSEINQQIEDEDEIEPSRFKGPNSDILGILFDMKNVERASGNILEGDVYNNAIKHLKNVTTKLNDVKDVKKFMKKATKKAKAAVKQIIKNRQQRVLKGGMDIMDKADILIAQRREESDEKFKMQSLKKEAMRQRLLVVLEEEQERERERETFWWSKTTQSRSIEEQKQLAAVFDQEREAASSRIMLLTQSIALAERNQTQNIYHDDDDDDDTDEEHNDNSVKADMIPRNENKIILQNIDEEVTFEMNKNEFSNNNNNDDDDEDAALNLFESSIASLVDDVFDGEAEENLLDGEGKSHLSLPSIENTNANIDKKNNDIGVNLDEMFYESADQLLPVINQNQNQNDGMMERRDHIDVEEEKRQMKLEKKKTKKVMRELLQPFVEDVKEIEKEHDMMKQRPYVLLIHNELTEEEKEKKIRKEQAKKEEKRQKETLKQQLKRQQKILEKKERSKAIKERQLRAKMRHESIHLRKDIKFQNKLIVRDVQADRMRQRPRVAFGTNGNNSMAHVLDDPDSIGIIKNKSIVSFESMVDNTLNDESTLNISAPTSGIFWGQSMELVDNQDSELPMDRMASTTVGGGVFWGDWVNEGDIIDEGAEEREENEEHKTSRGGLSSAGSAYSYKSQRSTKTAATASTGNVHPITHLLTIYRKRFVGGPKLSDRIKTFNLKGRSAKLGGLGKLETKYRVLNCGDPMFTCSTKVSGSINQGRGAYAIVTVYDGGGGPNEPNLRTDLVLAAYLPATCEHLVVRINRAEVSMFLNKSTDWFSANDVHDGKASMQYMRPYWQKKISPIVHRLQIHLQMIGGENYISRDLYLDVDRCILSKTKVKVPCIEDQKEFNDGSFPNNAAIVVRVERSIKKDTNKKNEKKEYDASGNVVEKKLRDWEIHEGPPGSELIIFAITVVSRRQNGVRDTMRKSISLAHLTRHLKLPKKPMLMVADEKRDELCNAILKSLRFVYLSPVEGDPTDENGRFRRYTKAEAMMEAELDFVFKWAKPSRRPITFVDPSKAPSPVKELPSPKQIDDSKQDEEDLKIAEESAAVQMQRVYRGFKDRNVVNLKREEMEKEMARKLKEEQEREETERQLMHQEDISMRNYIKELAKKQKEEDRLNNQFAYRVVKTNVNIDGKRVSITINVTDKPSLHIAFIVVVHEHSNKKLLLTLSEGEKLDGFIDHYCNNDEGRPIVDNIVAGLQQNDYPNFVDLMVKHLQLFHSKKNNVMVLSLKAPLEDAVDKGDVAKTMITPKRKVEGKTTIVDIDADLDTTDLFLKDGSVLKTPPATPSFVPTLDMESVKKSKRRRRRVKLGMPAKGGTPKKTNTNIDLKKKFDKVATDKKKR